VASPTPKIGPVLIALILFAVAVTAVAAVALLHSSQATEAREARYLDPERVEREVYEKLYGKRSGTVSAPLPVEPPLKADVDRPRAHMPSADPRPRTNRDPSEVKRKLALLRERHIAPLTDFVERLRESKPEAAVPYFDPTEAGAEARILLLLSAPGRRSALEAGSGFVSSDNDDQTAQNMWNLLQEAGIDRGGEVATWNVVPWYIGDGTKIRPAQASDVAEARQATRELLSLMHKVRVVVLLGRPAAKAWRALGLEIETIEAPHPSPLNLNTRPERREEIRVALIQARSRAIPS
jgi:uracil-DNA glycosylase